MHEVWDHTHQDLHCGYFPVFISTYLVLVQRIQCEKIGDRDQGLHPNDENHQVDLRGSEYGLIFEREHYGYEPLQVDHHQAADGGEHAGPLEVLADVDAADEVPEGAVHGRRLGEEIDGHAHQADQDVDHGEMDQEVAGVGAKRFHPHQHDADEDISDDADRANDAVCGADQDAMLDAAHRPSPGVRGRFNRCIRRSKCGGIVIHDDSNSAETKLR